MGREKKTHTHNMTDLSLNIFILHRLRNKFLQLILISLDSASWELHQYSCRMCGPMKNPKVETRSRDSNLGPHDCKAHALPHDHGHHMTDLKTREVLGKEVNIEGKGENAGYQHFSSSNDILKSSPPQGC